MFQRKGKPDLMVAAGSGGGNGVTVGLGCVCSGNGVSAIPAQRNGRPAITVADGKITGLSPEPAFVLLLAVAWTLGSDGPSESRPCTGDSLLLPADGLLPPDIVISW